MHDHVEPAWHIYVIRVRDAGQRRTFFDYLRSEGLLAQLHYTPVHMHPTYQDLGHGAGDYPNAEDYSARAMSIPLFPRMTDDDADRVIETVIRGARELL